MCSGQFLVRTSTGLSGGAQEGAEQVGHLALERDDRLIQRRTGKGVQEVGVPRDRTAPEIAMLPDGQVPRPACFVRVECDEEPSRRQVARIGDEFSPESEPRMGLVDLVGIPPARKARERLAGPFSRSSDFGLGQNDSLVPRRGGCYSTPRVSSSALLASRPARFVWTSVISGRCRLTCLSVGAESSALYIVNEVPRSLAFRQVRRAPLCREGLLAGRTEG